MSQATGRCLVIGANGFIGSHIVDKLVEAGYLVRAFDRFSREPQFNSSKNIEIIKGDFFDDMAVSRALKNIEYVFHSFSATTPSTADSDPYTDVSSNLLRNIQLFEKSVEAGVNKVIYVSSGGAIYGNIAEDKVVSEDDAPDPVSPYGIGKLASEHYLAYFKRKHGLDYVSFRLSNPYGPRQVTKNSQGVVPLFINKMLNNEEITVIGDGSSTRDYIYIEDAASMMTAAFQSAEHHIYNLGRGKQTSINEIVSTLKELLNKEPIILNVDEPKTFVKHTNISIVLFENEFNPQKYTDLKSGLVLTIDNLKSRR